MIFCMYNGGVWGSQLGGPNTLPPWSIPVCTTVGPTKWEQSHQVPYRNRHKTADAVDCQFWSKADDSIMVPRKDADDDRIIKQSRNQSVARYSNNTSGYIQPQHQASHRGSSHVNNTDRAGGNDYWGRSSRRQPHPSHSSSNPTPLPPLTNNSPKNNQN